MTPDVNVLVAASRQDHPHHTIAHAWLVSAVSAARARTNLGLLPTVVASFLRLVTHSKIFVVPTPIGQAIAFVDALLASPGVALLGAHDEWSQLRTLCLEGSLSGNDLPDAWIAACVLQQKEVLATFDRDFVRLLPPKRLQLLKAP